MFVDDEQKVLDGLQRMLYPMRNEWRMSFVTSPRQALQLLAEAEYDVLVTDLRMAEMSGLEFLLEVVKSFPHAVRLVLSGTADQEITLRSTTLAHQYLLKPCDAATLRTTVSRAFSLRVMLGDPSLKRLISSIQALPSVPAVYAQLVQVLEKPDVSPNEIGQVIGQDMSMTAKVLQLVNSAFFGVRRQITDPTEAVIYLGAATVRDLVLVTSVFSTFRLRGMRHFSIESLQDHSLAVGALARRISESLQLPKPFTDQAYVGGLLHEVGKLVLASKYPEKYEEAIEHAAQAGIPERIAELETFGTTHAEVGAYLLWLWALPDTITEVVLRHHEFPGDLQAARTPAAIVYLADVLVKGGLEQEHAVSYLAALGLGHKVDGWIEKFRESGTEK
jgi:HD-like signal output (HDOD) protein/ActR/RegA family two-component response regulator